MKLDLRPPPALLGMVDLLEGAGYESWVVGGVVRDALNATSGVLPNARTAEGGVERRAPTAEVHGDWDLATRARPKTVLRLFRRTVRLGIEHGTVGVIGTDGVLYQVTTFRRDIETDGRHAVVTFADTIEEDLARRDFTINALAWHPVRRVLIDPFGGASDLEDRILRAVGEARERFREDHLRILRGFRFAGGLDLRVEANTWRAMRENLRRLTRLSAERLREELVKVLSARRPSAALGLYLDSGALAVLYPELSDLDARGWRASLGAVDHLPPWPFLRLAALVRCVGSEEVARLAERLKLSRLEARRLQTRTKAVPLPLPDAPAPELRRWLAAGGRECLNPAARLDLALARTGGGVATPTEIVSAWRRLRSIIGRGDPLTVGEIALGGNDLKLLGVESGPRMGEILSKLLAEVLEDPSRNNEPYLEARVRALVRSHG